MVGSRGGLQAFFKGLHSARGVEGEAGLPRISGVKRQIKQRGETEGEAADAATHSQPRWAEREKHGGDKREGVAKRREIA